MSGPLADEPGVVGRTGVRTDGPALANPKDQERSDDQLLQRGEPTMRGGDGARWEVPREARGPVWVRCPHKEMTLLVDEALKVTGGARLHHGGKEPPPGGMTPSTIVLCPSGDESIASAIGHVKAQAPGIPVLLFLGSREDLQPAKSALEGGAHGLLHGGMRPDQVANALASASRGEVVIPEEILWGLATAEEAEEGGGREGPRPAGLPARQREIVGLVSKGLSDAQVAKRLSLPEHSVKRELHAAYRTLRFKRRIKEAIASRQSQPERFASASASPH